MLTAILFLTFTIIVTTAMKVNLVAYEKNQHNKKKGESYLE